MIKCSALALAFAWLLAQAACGDDAASSLAPEFSAPGIALSVIEDGTIAIDASATDPEDRALSYMATAPAHGALSGTAPHYTYTPEAGFSGIDTFTITVSNGVASLEIPVTITVQHVNVAPVAADQQVSTHFYTPVAITLAASDGDGDALSYEIVVAPQHGALTGTPPSLTYTPAEGFGGIDAFTFTASDGELTSSVATVTVTVAGCPAVAFTSFGTRCAR